MEAVCQATSQDGESCIILSTTHSYANGIERLCNKAMVGISLCFHKPAISSILQHIKHRLYG